MNATIELDYFGGYAPIQAWGKFDEHHFYFRARWDEWRFEIGKPGIKVPASDKHTLIFVREGEFLADDFHKEMASIIVVCFQDFFAESQNPLAADLLADLNSKLLAAMSLENQ